MFTIRCMATDVFVGLIVPIVLYLQQIVLYLDDISLL